jgi:hypothetical protein
MMLIVYLVYRPMDMISIGKYQSALMYKLGISWGYSGELPPLTNELIIDFFLLGICVVTGFMAIKFSDYAVAIGTSITGSYMLSYSILEFVHYAVNDEYIRHPLMLFYKNQIDVSLYFIVFYVVAFLVLFASGVLVQRKWVYQFFNSAENPTEVKVDEVAKAA